MLHNCSFAEKSIFIDFFPTNYFYRKQKAIVMCNGKNRHKLMLV